MGPYGEYHICDHVFKSFALFFQKHDLSPLTQDECTKLLLRKGFFKKNDAEEYVPADHQDGPYKEKTESQIDEDLKKWQEAAQKQRDEDEALLESIKKNNEENSKDEL